MIKINKTGFLFLSFLLLFILLLFIGQSFDVPIRDGMPAIVLRLSSDPKSFNPIIAQETSTTSVTSLMFEGLVRIEPFTQEPIPNIAMRWQVFDDGLRWRFFLRKDVHWSDGVPLTAKDVKFTFESLIFNPDVPNSAKDIFTIDGKPIKLKIIDDYTVDFILPDKFAPFLEAMTQEIMPEHVLRPYVERSEFNSAWGIGSSIEEIVCNGPYKLRRFLPGQLVELEANPYYWRRDRDGNRLPKIRHIIFMIIPSNDTAILKFLEGELDVVSLRPMDYILLKKMNRAGVRLINLGPSLGTNFISFNQNEHAPIPEYKLNWFRDVRFRKAFAYIIDREGIIDTIYSGLGIAQFGPLNSSCGFFYYDGLCRYKFNTDEAKHLLYEMGFADTDRDGILEDKDGHRLELTLVTNANSDERLQLASIISMDAAKIGIKIDFIGISFNNLVTRLTSSFDWEIVLIGLTGGYEPHFSRNVWFSGGSLHIWYPNQSVPATEWEKEIDEIFDKAVGLLNREERKKLYGRWQRIVSCYVPVVYTITPLRLSAVRDRFVGIKPSPYAGILYNIEEWEMKD